MGEIPEEAADQIRAAVGKARLLCNPKGRFHQFGGLVDDCEFNRGDRPTTCSDLQGFWDMVYFQVEDVDRLFRELDELEANGWVPKRREEERDSPRRRDENRRPRKRPLATSATSAAKVSKRPPSKPNPVLREMMSAGRKELKAEKALPSPSLLEARTPSSVLRPVNRSVEKVFEGGFFAVRSPVHRSASPDARGRRKREGAGESAATAARLEFDDDEETAYIQS